MYFLLSWLVSTLIRKCGTVHANNYLNQMDRKNMFSRVINSIHFHFRPTRVILRLALLSMPMVLLAWRLTDLADEFQKGEIHMSTSAGVLTGMTALLFQVVIILGLALISWWVIRIPQVPPEIVGSE
jgi:hypothetical protein